MRLVSWLWVLCAVVISSNALHEADVGVVDWHKPLIGVPLTSSTTTAPKFAAKDVVITATSSNVLAALSAKDGSIIWRYVFNADDPISDFYHHNGVVVALSGSSVRQFDLATGDVLLENSLNHTNAGVPFLGKSVAFDDQGVFVLTNGYVVTRLDRGKGEPQWTWSAPDATSLTMFTKLISSPEATYVVGISKSFSSLTLHVVALSPETGEVLTSRDIPSSITNPFTEVIYFDKQHTIVWVEGAALKSFVLDTGLTNKPKTAKGVTLATLVDVGLTGEGLFLGQQPDGSTQLLQLGSSIEATHNFGNNALGPQFTGGINHDGKPVVARASWSPELQQIALDVVGTGSAQQLTLPFDTNAEGVIDHITLQLTADGEPQVIATASSGAIQAFNSTHLQWSRQEALASTILSEFVELPERIVAESTSGSSVEGYFDRLARHAVEAQDLPKYLVNFARRFVTGSYASATSSAVSEGLFRDTFGFRQIIVSATLNGKIFGIDSSNGNVLWTRSLGLGSAFNVGGAIAPSKMYVVKTVSEGSDPEIVIVAERRSADGIPVTVLYHFNALNGEDLTGSSFTPSFLEGVEIMQGAAAESFILDGPKKVVLIMDASMNVHLYPDTPESRAAYSNAHTRLSFPIRKGAGVVGHQLALSEDKPSAFPTWTTNFPAGEEVQRLIPAASKGPIASLGKVLGNRSTLYKYLNPRLFIALTAAPNKGTCGIHVLDSAKGTPVYSREVKAHSGVCDVQATLVENWLTYHYYESEAADGSVKGSKGYRLVSVEFYEGSGPDEKIRSSEVSSFSVASTDLTAYEESFVFPHAITTISPTSTKFGITGKDLIFATKNGKIQSFPRRYLDPRRPHRKPTSEESEEGLIQYEPLIIDDPKRVLSHKYDVANVKRIVTAPALLESTSLVLAFGLDMFLTRVAPSGTFDVLSENFNKAQLVVTISGLALAIFITKPMVQRKRLREKWYQ